MIHFSKLSLKGWIWIGYPNKLAEPEVVSILKCPILSYNAKRVSHEIYSSDEICSC